MSYNKKMGLRTIITDSLKPALEIIFWIFPEKLRILIVNSNMWFHFYEKHTSRHKQYIEEIKSRMQEIKEKAKAKND